ncbi:hypothetical protein FHY05_004202 [Sphingomonas sp. BK580]|nr:hypothetical protein [Sphingomonas sp. BK580]
MIDGDVYQRRGRDLVRPNGQKTEARLSRAVTGR